MKFLNFKLLTPMNVISIGAIVFFWGTLAYFVREQVADDDTAGTTG